MEVCNKLGPVLKSIADLAIAVLWTHSWVEQGLGWVQLELSL